MPPHILKDDLNEAGRQRREAETPEQKNLVIGTQIADELIRIRWQLASIVTELQKARAAK